MSSEIVLCIDCKNFRLCFQSGRIQSGSEPICENFSQVTCGDCYSYEYCMNVGGTDSDDSICECFHHRIDKGAQNG